MQTEISKVYDKTRDELIQYEDSEFALLTSHVPNFYISINDQTYWGSLLRNIAAELGRLEYFHAYDMMGKDPSYLNPADVRRVWNDPLFINRNYPSDTQYDLDYKNMVINLLKAYKEGATPQAISDVIAAYTGEVIPIVELFKYTDTAPYDESYRNTITSLVKILNLGDPNTEAYANKLYTISHDLYGAIDLAKPAHVGLQLGLVLGGKDDKFRAIIDDVETVQAVDVLPDPNSYNASLVGALTLWENTSSNLYELVKTNTNSWEPVSRPTGSYILAGNVLHQFNGTSWVAGVEPGTDLLATTDHYYFNGTSWVYGTETVAATPRYCAGLRFIADFEENPLPDPLFEAPFVPDWQPPHADTGLASNSQIYADPYYGVNPGHINVFGEGFMSPAPIIIVEFTGAGNTWIPAIYTVVSDQQLKVQIPAGIVNGPIKVTVNTNTQFTPVDFMAQTTPVHYSRPGVLVPQLNRTWEIKSDNVDILNID